MNYVSLEFWLTLGAVLLPYLAVRRLVPESLGLWRFDKVFLFLLSCTLFALESLHSFAIFIGVGALVFAAASVVPRAGRFRWALVVVVAVLALLPLGYYKYRGFLTGAAPAAASPGSLLIPIGISFYTFQLIGLLIDHAKAPGERVGLLGFFNFASFFPQIVAGPIERKASLLPQIEAFRFRFDPEGLGAGLRFVVLGLFYKLVLADNLASASGWTLAPVESPWLV
jgi:D-alanyl-lipoteichoic acid acyltransferase DltB (MBOAT superfamily)